MNRSLHCVEDRRLKNYLCGLVFLNFNYKRLFGKNKGGERQKVVNLSDFT